jgi:CRISPR-associated protein Csh2
MEKKDRKEILFYYESRQNPNGDPGFEDQPRLLSDGTIMVTDVRIKRTIRDYIGQNVADATIFVDYDKAGNPTKADDRAKEILEISKEEKPKAKEESLPHDTMKKLLVHTHDVSLFGAFIPIRAADNSSGGSWFKLTGPLQFGLGRSINKVNILNPMIVGRFVGKEKQQSKEQFSTFGKYYSVEYALIKIHGGINPANLGKYHGEETVRKRFDENVQNLPFYLWNGTDQLITRSKFPQRSILYLEIEYDSVIYNDLPLLVKEKDEIREEKITSLPQSPFIFDDLIKEVGKRKDKIKKIRILCSSEIETDINTLITKLKEEIREEKIEKLDPAIQPQPKAESQSESQKQQQQS